MKKRYPIAVRLHLFIHRKGHRITKERRDITPSLFDISSQGWFFECSCGELWAY